MDGANGCSFPAQQQDVLTQEGACTYGLAVSLDVVATTACAPASGLLVHLAVCSAAAMLETLYFYALGHQNDFDVCWPRGSIAETIFTPMVNRIKASGGQVSLACVSTGASAEPICPALVLDLLAYLLG